jgi:hypothetical protein
MFVASVVTLIVCVIGFVVATRSPRLRRYRRVILAVGVLAFAVFLYDGWDQLSAGFMDGFLPWR